MNQLYQASKCIYFLFQIDGNQLTNERIVWLKGYKSFSTFLVFFDLYTFFLARFSYIKVSSFSAVQKLKMALNKQTFYIILEAFLSDTPQSKKRQN